MRSHGPRQKGRPNPGRLCARRRKFGARREDRHEMVKRHVLRVEPVRRRRRAWVEDGTLDLCRRKELRGVQLLWELLQGRAGQGPV